MGIIATLAAIGMSVGPPLAYADQFAAIVRNKSSAGFSKDVCGVLLVANITRIWYWFGEHYQLEREPRVARKLRVPGSNSAELCHQVLIQSVLMVAAQFALLYVCLEYRPTEGQGDDTEPGSKQNGRWQRQRPGNLWDWPDYGSYIEFCGIVVLVHGVVFAIMHWSATYVTVLGFAALGTEATLPVPQFLKNAERKSTEGFRLSVLASWVLGDSFKMLYFLFTGAPLPFAVCAAFQLSVDAGLCVQTWMYRGQSSNVDVEADQSGSETLLQEHARS